MQLAQVALQLYTLRDHCRTVADFAATARRVRAIGYTAVELAGLGPISEHDILAICSGEGLAICASHEPAARLLDQPAAIADRLLRLGVSHAVFPYPHGIDFADPAAVDRFIRRLDSAGAHLRAAGLSLAYHNHAHEFFRPIPDGPPLLERIYAETAPENLVAELDTHWVQRGGGDPVDWVHRLSQRLPLLHLKDYRVGPDGSPDFAEIGAGTLPFDRIIPAAEAAGCAWYIVEQDVCRGDPFDSVRQSLAHVISHLLA